MQVWLSSRTFHQGPYNFLAWETPSAVGLLWACWKWKSFPWKSSVLQFKCQILPLHALCWCLSFAKLSKLINPNSHISQGMETLKLQLSYQVTWTNLFVVGTIYMPFSFMLSISTMKEIQNLYFLYYLHQKSGT